MTDDTFSSGQGGELILICRRREQPVTDRNR